MNKNTYKYFYDLRHDVRSNAVCHLHKRDDGPHVGRRFAADVLLHHGHLLAGGHDDPAPSLLQLHDAPNAAHGVLPPHSHSWL